MEPVSTFVTIVGLIGLFKAQRDVARADGEAAKSANITEYIEWLRRHDHLQIVEMLESDREMLQSVQDLIAGNHLDVISKLSELESLVSTIAEGMAAFKPIIHAIARKPVDVLSAQAIDILRQMNAVQASELYEIRANGELVYLTDKAGEIRISDQRFIKDDISKLKKYGMLFPGRFISGVERVYVITRAGAAFGNI